MGKYKIYIDNTYPSSTLYDTGIVTAPKRNISGEVKLKKVNASEARSFYINGSLTKNLNPINIKSKLPAGIQSRMNRAIENYIGDSRWSYIEGCTDNLKFYFGYDDPRLETTQLIDYSTVDISNYIWEGAEIGNTQHEDSWYADKYFYCAIPITYSDVLPRWYAYNHESTESSDCVDDGTINHSNPLNCDDWFDIISSRYTRNGIDFKIYKHKVKGKFYGFIK